MRKKIVYKVFIFIFIISLVIIIYSIYEISSSKNKVLKNTQAWDTNEKIWNDNEKTKENGDLNLSKEPEKVTIKEESQNFDIIGKLTIDRTGSVFPIIQGTTDEDLKNGAGHYLDSVMPGKKGNSIIFGHRDGVFKTLDGVNVGDLILVETSLGKFVYEITNLRITSPLVSEIIKHYEEPMLTLVTCYPFNYLGTAPKRFIVTAKLKI